MVRFKQSVTHRSAINYKVLCMSNIKIRLLNDGNYGDSENVKFPVEVEATECGLGFEVSQSELERVGFEDIDYKLYFSMLNDECEIVTDEPTVQENDVNPMGITKQFYERDEMQSIINLTRDAIAREERITELERVISNLKKEVNDFCDEYGCDLKYPEEGHSYE